MHSEAFFVTVIHGKRVGYLLGPYSSHDEALKNVDRARELARKADAWSDFYSFGTAKWKGSASVPKSVFGW